jgi:hypothetical protein
MILDYLISTVTSGKWSVDKRKMFPAWFIGKHCLIQQIIIIIIIIIVKLHVLLHSLVLMCAPTCQITIPEIITGFEHSPKLTVNITVRILFRGFILPVIYAVPTQVSFFIASVLFLLDTVFKLKGSYFFFEKSSRNKWLNEHILSYNEKYWKTNISPT